MDKDNEINVAVLAERTKRAHEDTNSLREEVHRLGIAVSELAAVVAAIKPVNIIMQSALIAIVAGVAVWIITNKR